MKNMKLSELLRRKMDDYGYGSEEELAEALGITPERLECMLSGIDIWPEIYERQAMHQVLDIDPGVLQMLVYNPKLKDYEVETIIAYKRNHKMVRETARALFIHECTAGWRLRQIKKKTGLDPRVEEDLEALLAGVRLRGGDMA